MSFQTEQATVHPRTIVGRVLLSLLLVLPPVLLAGYFKSGRVVDEVRQRGRDNETPCFGVRAFPCGVVSLEDMEGTFYCVFYA